MAGHTPGPWAWHNQMGDKTLCANGKAILYADASWMNTHDGVCVSDPDAALIAAAPDLLAACEAAIRYDEAIQSCANDPDKMASHCTAQSECLDVLYFDWLDKARAGIAEIQGEAD